MENLWPKTFLGDISCQGKDVATDNAGNNTTQTVTYRVGYKIVALFDQTKLHNSGSTIPIKFQVANASGANLSAANIAVTALRVMPGHLSVQSPGNSQTGNLFKFENDTVRCLGKNFNHKPP